MATLVSPGDTHTYRQDGDMAVVVYGLELWTNRQEKWVDIHVTGLGGAQITTTNNPDSTHYYPSLFYHLRRTLLNENRWPFGVEGAEVEDSDPAAHLHPVSIRGGSISDTIIAERGE